MSTSAATVKVTSIILDTQADWDEWLSSIYAYAQARDIFHLIDLKKTVQPTHQPRPDMPVIKNEHGNVVEIENLLPDQREIYKLRYQQYKDRTAEVDKEKKALQEVIGYIRDTTTRRNLLHVDGLNTPWSLLKALQKRLAPNDRARKVEVARQYQQLKKAPRIQQTDSWLNQWEYIYAQARKIGLPDVQDNRALFDFVAATKAIDPEWASPYMVQLEVKEGDGIPLPELVDAIEVFRHHLRVTRPAYKPTTLTALATLQGEEATELPSKEAPQQSKSQQQAKPKRDCACGESSHTISKCPYILAKNRAPGWVADARLQKKVDEALASNTGLRIAVERIRKQAEQRQRNKSKASELQGDNAQQGSTSSTQPTSLATALTIHSENNYLQNCWILDSAASTHVCNSRERFVFERQADEDDLLYSGLQAHPIEAYGHVVITIQTPTGPQPIKVENVALVPGYLTNLVSARVIKKKGVFFDTKDERLYTGDGITFCYAPETYNHYILEHNPPNAATALANSKAPRKDRKATARSWHETLGHVSPETVEHLEENVDGAKVTHGNPATKSLCETCHLSTARKLVSRRAEKEHPAEEPFIRVNYDLIPMELAFNNDKYVSHFTCSYTGYDWAWTHAKKSQSVSIVDAFLNLIENRYGRRVQFFHTDGETSLGGDFETLIAREGMTTERTAPYTPDQNGHAERSGGVILAKARSMRIAASLPSNLWPEMIHAAVYLKNRTPRKQLGWKTQFEMLHQKKPSLAHLHVYGCRAYPLNKHIPRLQKLEPRAHIGYLVGYDSTNIFRIWIPSLEKVVRTRDVTFMEETYYDPADVDIGHLLRENVDQVLEILEPLPPFVAPATSVEDEELLDLTSNQENTSQPSSTKSSAILTPFTSSSASKSTTPSGYLPSPENTPDPEDLLSAQLQQDAARTSPSMPNQVNDHGESASRNDREDTADEEAPPTRRKPYTAPSIAANISQSNVVPEGSKRVRKPARKLAHDTALALTSELGPFHIAFAMGTLKMDTPLTSRRHRDTLPPEPRSWKEMKRHQFAAEFMVAAGMEVKELEKKRTFEWVKRDSVDKLLLPLKWVFKYKFDTDGYLIKFKARICARGDLQATEQDTYAATLAARTFRALMAIAAAFNLEIKQYDAVNAFANSALNEEIYCLSPEGFERDELCWRLLRALYGLKQSPLLWYNDFTSALEDFGLHQVPGVNCLFSNDHLIVFFYVDDVVVLFSAKNAQVFQKFECDLLQRFEMREIGDLKWFLGVRVERDRPARKLWLCQDSYITKIAARYNIDTTARPPKTPLPLEELTAADEGYEATVEQKLGYQQRVGSANFASVITRPDIAYSVSKLSQFLKKPTTAHRSAADRVISYLSATRGLAIEFSGDETGPIFNCASDAAFADDPDTRKSSDGYLFKLYGGAIDWKASKQKTVTTSSTEAELLSLSAATREVMWWKRFFTNIQFDTQQRTEICCDNMQTIRILQKEGLKLDTKLRHVDIHQHWLRQEVQARKIELKWLPTAEMPADGLTKALPTQKHALFVAQLNLVDISSRLTVANAMEEEEEE